MRYQLLVVLLSWLPPAGAASLKIPSAAGPLVIDGQLDDAVWRNARVLPLGEAETRIAVRGSYLCLSARIPEADRVVAISQGQNPAWWKEDLVTWTFTVHIKGRNRTLTVSLNPLGAWRIDSTAAEGPPALLAAARIGSGLWTAEAAIPLEALSDIGYLSIERIRAPRPDAPELRWQWPATHERADFELPPVTHGDAPVFRPQPPPSAPGEPRLVPEGGLAGELASLPDAVVDPKLVRANLEARMAAAAASERREWEKVRTRQDWERFRDPRLAALRNSLGAFPARTPLRAVITRRADWGDGFVIENVVFESRPRLLVTANLYLPAKIAAPVSAIVVVHSHHAPKTQSELQDMGMTWARAGVVVLVMDQLGAGERVQSQMWPRESYYSRYALGMQLYLAGESLMKWMVWDLMRGIDLLIERPYIDPERIVVLGAVAGGGDPAAVTAALDPRIAAVIPFNFGEAGPEQHYTMGPRPYDSKTAAPGFGGWESTRNLRRSAADQFFPWFICSSVAPRPFLYSFEIGWPKTVEDEPMWARYKKVFEFYGKPDHLAEVHGFGPFPGPGECTNVGTFLRQRMYPVLKRWLDMPVPAEEYHNPRPDADLMCLTQALCAERKPLTVAALAARIARERLQAARANPAKLRALLQAKLGDIEPSVKPAARVLWSRPVAQVSAEAISLETEPGLAVPLLILKPKQSARTPVVIALAQDGKKRFLSDRSAELAKMLEAGIAVCLADVRGAGDAARGPGAMGLAATELMLANTMLGARLKDARTIFRYVAGRSDLDPKRIVLWGDSFVPANPRDLALDKSPGQPVGPQIQAQAEPLGALLAMLTALYEPQAMAVAARRGLVSFLSVLEDRFTYVPLDMIVPGMLEAGDVPDVARALAPRPLLLQAFVDGRNRPQALTENYGGHVTSLDDAAPPLAADWIIARCRSGP